MKLLLKLSAAVILLAPSMFGAASSAPATEQVINSQALVRAVTELAEPWAQMQTPPDTAYTASTFAHSSAAGGFNLYFIFVILLLAVTSRALRQ